MPARPPSPAQNRALAGKREHWGADADLGADAAALEIPAGVTYTFRTP